MIKQYWIGIVIFSCSTLCIWLQYKLALLLGGHYFVNYPQQMRVRFTKRGGKLKIVRVIGRYGRILFACDMNDSLYLFCSGLVIAALVWLFNPFGKLESLMGCLLNSGSAKLPDGVRSFDDMPEARFSKVLIINGPASCLRLHLRSRFQ